jgi:hypothetical protein
MAQVDLGWSPDIRIILHPHMGRSMIGYRHFLDILLLCCGIDQVMIPGPESRPALIFLKRPSPTFILSFTSFNFDFV